MGLTIKNAPCFPGLCGRETHWNKNKVKTPFICVDFLIMYGPVWEAF